MSLRGTKQSHKEKEIASFLALTIHVISNQANNNIKKANLLFKIIHRFAKENE